MLANFRTCFHEVLRTFDNSLNVYCILSFYSHMTFVLYPLFKMFKLPCSEANNYFHSLPNPLLMMILGEWAGTVPKLIKSSYAPNLRDCLWVTRLQSLKRTDQRTGSSREVSTIVNLIHNKILYYTFQIIWSHSISDILDLGYLILIVYVLMCPC